ncbi:uncharacterized protein STEHIDRAFT_152068 [Stereum hirsutum FP-91666 SS1]|uniref:uncharacterized protein n=1 Tax=Stereum hirsutum (strain FP-91666) TaxID=721885 RepID=UPI000440F254|nr:uncharacterized protein STEHIDRAFT_152068 [Stereum hirsutum FP-91666 SS1]EIM92756.1 hypothetical protein STEHIDRAFT_152068 [Stereum hirsutum FP-91666 SS1]
MPPTQAQEVRPFVGVVETTVDAMHIALAARLGIIPRIQRRLNDEERSTMLKSGAVFCFGVEESGIKRWTDGIAWTRSRILGNFLVYREVVGTEAPVGRGPSLHSTGRALAGDRSRPEDALGPLNEDALWKKTISIRMEGTLYHVISYFTEEDLRLGRLQRPTSRRDLMQLVITPNMILPSDFRAPPPIKTGQDGRPYLFDAEERSSYADSERRSFSIACPIQQEQTSAANSFRDPAASQELQGFMHRWAIPLPEGESPHEPSISPTLHTLSFPPLHPPTSQQFFTASSSSGEAYYGDNNTVYQDSSYYPGRQDEDASDGDAS